MNEPVFLLGKRRAPFEQLSREVLRSAADVRKAYAKTRRALWVVVDGDALALLMSARVPSDTFHRVLLLERATTARRELLHAHFRVVVAPDDDVLLLPPNELVDVMRDERRDDLFIGGVVDREDAALVLYRGNLDRLVVPLEWFEARPKARPSFSAFAIIDGGQTVKLGAYEVAADAILYAFDSDARRRMKGRALEQDSSFGGAVRRLRLQKGLSRADFRPISAKTIARIERGDVEAPRGHTLGAIAKHLGVKPEEIESY